jgi:hypothetical protein
MTVDYILAAHSHIHELVTGSMVLSSRQYDVGNGLGVVVECMVMHPKRLISPTSFVRSAKKKGLIGSGTPDACNRNKLIVAYVTVADRSAELCIKGTNEGHLRVEVRFKGNV